MGPFVKFFSLVLALALVVSCQALPVAASEGREPDTLVARRASDPARKVDTLTAQPRAPQETEPAAPRTVHTLTARPRAGEEPQETVPEETVAEPVRTGPDALDLASREIPHYFQNDYPDVRYGGGTIESGGCSITSLAMMATHLTGKEYHPDQLAAWFGGRGSNNMERLEYGCSAMQLPFEKSVFWPDTLEALKAGKVAILLMEEDSLFTQSQHFIVLAGMTEEGRFLVNDPNRDNYDRWDLKEGFTRGFEEWQIVQGISGAWIFDKEAMPEQPFLYTQAPMTRANTRYPHLNLTTEEIDLLASLIWVEAQGEPFEGQQAVAEVVLNRLVSGKFGETLSNVVYGEGQFRSVPFLPDAMPIQTQYDAIEYALCGPNVVPLEVTHFATFEATDRVWGKIGNHIFCYADGTEEVLPTQAVVPAQTAATQATAPAAAEASIPSQTTGSTQPTQP